VVINQLGSFYRLAAPQDNGACAPLPGLLLGFVSGAGWSAVGDQRDTTIEEATTFVTTFCRQHPGLLLHQGAAALVRDLERSR